MKQAYFSHKSISLVELILVLTIMILFAGITINLYPDISRKSKLTANYENMLNVYNASLAFEAERQNAIPGGMHSLLTEVSAGTFDFSLFYEGVTGTGADLTIGTVTDMATAMGGLLTPTELYTQLNNYNLFEVNVAPNLGAGHVTLDLPGFSGISMDPASPPSQPIVYIDTETATLSRVQGMLGDDNYRPPLDSFNETLLLCFGIDLTSELLNRSNSGLSVPPVYFPDVAIVSPSVGTPVSIENYYFRYINIYEARVTPNLKLLVRFLTTVRPNEQNSTGALPFVSMASDFEKIAQEFND